ncbi:MAG TPA: glycosyl hydrolase family 28 protein [Acidobacteriaceae bacterium]|nr:glycosyl hydrolase family 28 protein [Acidobacteriaceae bacterium]
MSRKRFAAIFSVAAIALSCAPGYVRAVAQDSRTVTEPTIPPVCATARAQLAAPHGIEPADETKLDTGRLQSAIDSCAPGKALELAADGAKNAFLSGPLELRKGVTLLVDKGVTLYGSRNPDDYATRPGSCGVVNYERGGCRPLIHASHADGAGIMGEGTIDGRGGAKLLVNGKPGPESWWDLANDARKGGNQQVPRLIIFDACNNVTIYRITLKNSANFHVSYNSGDGFTVWGLRIDTPKNARNTDGVDPGNGSKNITVTHSFIRAGDDNIAIKGGTGGLTNMTVSHDHFYYGHGMSIGSETYGGVSKILVTDLSLDGDDNALRIKSNPTRGGLVQDVVYDDVCVRDSRNPILLDTAYSYPGKGKDLFPQYKDIIFRNVRISGGGKVQFGGLDAVHRVGVKLDGVELIDGAAKYQITAAHADVELGPGPVNFSVEGEDVKVSGKAGKGSLPSCSGRFVEFPE